MTKNLQESSHIWKSTLGARGDLRWDQAACIHHLNTLGFLTSELNCTLLVRLYSIPRKGTENIRWKQFKKEPELQRML